MERLTWLGNPLFPLMDGLQVSFSLISFAVLLMNLPEVFSEVAVLAVLSLHARCRHRKKKQWQLLYKSPKKWWLSDLSLLKQVLDFCLVPGPCRWGPGTGSAAPLQFSSIPASWLPVSSSFYWQGLSFTYKPLPRRSGFRSEYTTVNCETVHVTLLI